MDVTSEEIRSSRFQGTRHVYDRREVDAFLHRTAATLEIYERQLAVTQADVESLEEALDLAHGRVRAVRSHEARVAELEVALAAAQHNYESAMEQLSVRGEVDQNADIAARDIVRAAENRARALIEEAGRGAEVAQVEHDRVREEAEETATALLEAAKVEADQLLESARREHAAMLEDIAQTRRDAKAAIEAELGARRSLGESEAVNAATDGTSQAVEAIEAANAELAAKLEKVERKAAKAAAKSRSRLEAAENRAESAEAEIGRLVEELERKAAAAEAERRVFMEDAERMVAEAVARVEAERDAEAQDALGSRAEEPSKEVLDLRRQVAQMRTALAGIKQRFANAAALSPEELAAAAQLIELDVPNNDVVDLTGAGLAQANDLEPEPELVVKSRWVTSQPMHDRFGEEGSASTDVAASEPTWRDALATREPPAYPDADDNGSATVVGFYERRLAGLRARLKEAMPED